MGSFFYLKKFNFMLYGCVAILTPFLPLYFQEQGFNNVQIGLLMTVGPIISLIANPFWGYWSDKLQKKRQILSLLLLGNLIFSQLFFQAEGFLLVYILMFSFFFFQTAQAPINDSLILHSIEDTPYRFGSFRLWGSLGFAVVAVSSSPILERWGIESLSYIYGFFLIITLLFSFGLPAKGTQANNFSIKGLSQVLKNKYLLAFLVISLLVAIPNSMNYAFLSIYIDQLGGSKAMIGWAFFLSAICEIPVFLLLDRYFKRTPKMMIGLLCIGSLLFTLRWVLMSIVAVPFHIGFIQLMHSLTFGVYMYAGAQYCSYLMPDAYKASGMTIFAMTWMGLSGVFAGLLGGSIFEWGGGRLMYGLGAGIAMIGTIAFLIMLFRLQGDDKGNKKLEASS